MSPRIDGVSFTPVRGPAAQVLLRNRTREDVEVLDDAGRPFLRVGPRGVEGNVTSPSWFASGNPDGQGVPGVASGQPPRWKLVSRRPEWAYYEHRLHPSQVRLPPEARAARRPVRLLGFTVPFRHGGRPAKVTGHLEFRPLAGRVVPALRSGSRPLPGVTAAMLPADFPAVLLQNSGREPVTVLGRDGEPYARIARAGVDVNLRSPIHVEDLRHRGELPRVAADPDAPPLWRRVKDVPSFTWTEPRARYPYEQPPEAVTSRDEPAVLRTWSVPLRAGARRAELRGSTTWVPTEATGRPRDAVAADDGGGFPVVLLLLGGATVLAVGAAVVVRLRAGTRASG